MAKIFDRVKYNVSGTPGTGTVTIGTRSAGGFYLPAERGAADGDEVYYIIVKANGDEETGIGTVGGSVTTVSRDLVLGSIIAGTAGTTKINIDASAVMAFVAPAEAFRSLRGHREVTGATDTIANGDGGGVIVYNRATAIAASLAQAGASSQFLKTWFVYVQNIGAGATTITPATSTINGASTLVLGQNLGALIWSDGTNFRALIFRNDLGTAADHAADDFVRFDAGQTKTATQQAQARTNIGAASERSQHAIVPAKNLIVKTVSVTSVDIDADNVVLFDSAGASRTFASINLTAAITTAGANGLDTGSEGSSRWYAIWVIAKADGTVAGLLSESFSAPTLPADYIYKGFVGAIYNDGSSNFVAMFQAGASVSQTNQAALSGGTATSFTAVSLAAYVPPNARKVNIGMVINTTSGTNLVSIVVASDGSVVTPTYGIGGQLRLTADTNALIAGEASVLLSTAQQIKYYVFGTNPSGGINVRGWEY